jgi:acyl carrier protein
VNGGDVRYVHMKGNTVFEPEIADTLATIWARALKIESVDRVATFFDLGGTSLHAAQIANGVRDELGINMPLELFFKAPTVDSMARELTGLVDH